MLFFIHRDYVANPIDLLAKYANMTEEDVDIEIQEPYNLLKVYTCMCIFIVTVGYLYIYV